MPSPDNTRHQLLLSHAALTGLTPLIPVPLVDDLFYAYFLRSMVRQLAESHGKELTQDEIRVLATAPSRGCPLGCVGSVLLYPFKKVLRKIFFFLEWKRATDIISRTYYEGSLLDEALEQGWVEQHNATKVRAAINTVLARTNTSPLNGTVYGVVKQSKGVMRSMGKNLQSFVSGSKRRPGETEVAQAASAIEEDELLGGMINQLQRAVASLPTQHLQNLKQELAKELTDPSKSQ